MGIRELVEVSRRYGGDPRFVLAGGGNTSFKDEASLYIKASGFPLETIDADGFVRMERRKLAAIWDARYPEAPAEREKKALADLMASRAPGEKSKRPSVETLLHEAIGDAYVVHTHPALVNGVTCSVRGEETVKELFGDDALWIPIINPGYVLAVAVKRAREEHAARTGEYPPVIFLQNHGGFVSGDTVGEIDRLYERITSSIRGRLETGPDLSDVKQADTFCVENLRNAIVSAYRSVFSFDVSVSFRTNRETWRFVKDKDSFRPLEGAFSPDHIVYAGHLPLFLPISSARDDQLEGKVRDGLESYRSSEGTAPKICAVEKLGVFGCGSDDSRADTAIDLFMDAMKIAIYAESFGGGSFMPPEQTNFIRNWEVEQYRSTIGGGST